MTTDKSVAVARRLRDARDYDAALQVCQSIIDAGGEEHLEALRIRASVLCLQGRPEQAMADYRVLISTSPKMGDHYLAGNCAMELGDYVEANNCFERLVETGHARDEHDFDSAAYFLMAVCLREMGQTENALRHVDKATAIDPQIAMPMPGRDRIVSAAQLRQMLDGDV